jgi:hypothetical protein
MSQASVLGESPELLSPLSHRVLHPRLKLALGTVDSRLEDELERYRRYRAGRRLSPSAANLPRAPRLAEFIAAPPSTRPTGPMDEAGNHLDLDGSHLDGDAAPLALWQGERQGEPSDHDGLDMALTADDLPDDAFLASGPSDYLESSEELLRSLAEEEAGAAAGRHELEHLLTPLGVGSMLLMLLGSVMFGYLVMNPSSLSAMGQFFERIASGRKAPEAAVATAGTAGQPASSGMPNAPALDSQEFVNLTLNNFTAMRTNGLTTTKAIAPNGGAIELGSAPAKGALPNLALSPLPGPVTPSPVSISPIGVEAAPATTVTIGATAPARNNEPAPAPSQGLNLGIGRRSAPAPAYQPRRSEPTRSYEPAAPAYVPPVKIAPPPVLPTVTMPPPPAPEAPAPTPVGDYRVVVPYDNDKTLEKAQQAHPDSSFRNSEDGAVIQFGTSYGSKTEADTKAKELQKQGFSAEVK